MYDVADFPVHQFIKKINKLHQIFTVNFGKDLLKSTEIDSRAV